MTETILLPRPDKTLEAYQLKSLDCRIAPKGRFKSRVAYAAPHVVSDPLADVDPTAECRLDWDATLSYRHHLWSHGFAVAEALDTAQRGLGLDWTLARELIARSVREARAVDGEIACGTGTDHLSLDDTPTLDEVLNAYEEQCAFIESAGGRLILMASRALAQCAGGREDYVRVYGRILSQVSQPVILHWLGEAFDPLLAGYWGTEDTAQAMETVLGIIEEYRGSVDGIKISLLNPALEIEMRSRLPQGIRMYTGDDFHYDELILGDANGHSDALLGIFDAIAPVASAALHALDAGNVQQYESLMRKTVPLSRHIFQPPTRFYKTGLVFLAYLNGHQNHFRMPGGLESARSVLHLTELFRLADRAGLLFAPEAVTRMRRLLVLAGIIQR
jgi:hypothetical protein